MFCLSRKRSVLPALWVRFEMNGREVTLEESVIPEEKETLEAARDCLKHIFRKFRKRKGQDPIEIWIRGNHMEYFFEAIVCCRKVKKQVESMFEELNGKLSSI